MPAVNTISVRFVLCCNITRVNVTKNPTDSLRGKNRNHPLSLEIRTISCTVNLGFLSSLWELPTLKMESQPS